MFFLFFFFKQKTAYEMRISDWSSDVCSSDLPVGFIEPISVTPMMSLLVQRASVLMLRPAALMAEALLVPGCHVMIFAMPNAALALTASSIPVHTQSMMATSTSPNIECLERSDKSRAGKEFVRTFRSVWELTK